MQNEINWNRVEAKASELIYGWGALVSSKYNVEQQQFKYWRQVEVALAVECIP